MESGGGKKGRQHLGFHHQLTRIRLSAQGCQGASGHGICEVYMSMLDGLAVESKGGPVIIDDVSNKMINFTPFHL